MKTEMFTKTLTQPVLSFTILPLPSGRAFWEIQFLFYQKKQDFILQGDYTQEETPEDQTLFKRQTVGKCFSSSVLRFFTWHFFRCCGASKCQTSVPVLDIDYHNFQIFFLVIVIFLWRLAGAYLSYNSVRGGVHLRQVPSLIQDMLHFI